MTSLPHERRPLLTVMLLAIVLYPVFHLLDIVVYPEHRMALLTIRAVVLAVFLVCLWLLFRIADRWVVPLLWFFLVFCAAGISLMCVVVGEGFSSSYYSGIFLVISTGAAYLRFSPRVFNLIMLSIVGQHFLMLSFLPIHMKGFMQNLFFLGSATIITSMIQYMFQRLSQQVRIMEKLLPICAQCKKIRDKAGHWDHIEKYVEQRSETTFTHGLCPDCLQAFKDRRHDAPPPGGRP